MGLIYMYRNKHNNKRYIGQTTQSLDRRSRTNERGYYSYKNCSAMYRALKKYGWEGFEIIILEDNICDELLNSREEYYINYYNTYTPSGYNINRLVRGKVRQSENTKVKIGSMIKKAHAKGIYKNVNHNKILHRITDEGIELKRCSRCLEYKPLDMFRSSKTSWDKKHTFCKICLSSYEKERRVTNSNNKDKIKQWRQEEIKKRYKQYLDNPENRIKQKQNLAKKLTKTYVSIDISTKDRSLFHGTKELKNNKFDPSCIYRAISLNIPYKGKMWSIVNPNTSEYLIFDYEKGDINKMNIWNSIIASKENKLQNRIYARKCVIKSVSLADSKEFLNKNHLQGFINSLYNYGLYYNEELVCLMTFGKSRFDNKIEYELIRFCNKINMVIVGGASRLLKHFIRTINPSSIISYANKRYSHGNMYKQLGFNMEGHTPSNYFYEKGNRIIKRYQAMKHLLPNLLEHFDPNLTEEQNMLNSGFQKVKDKGNLRFVMYLK